MPKDCEYNCVSVFQDKNSLYLVMGLDDSEMSHRSAHSTGSCVLYLEVVHVLCPLIVCE